MTRVAGARSRGIAARRGAAAAMLALCWSAGVQGVAAQPASAPDRATPSTAAQAGEAQREVPHAGAATVTLQVTVTNVRSDRGRVRVAVCPRASFLQPSCAWHAFAPAHVGSVVVTVSGLPLGVYAVQSYLDENDDGKINRSLLGIPTEGLGFSNDAPMRFGPPSFDDAAIRLGSAGGAVSLRLRYFN